MHEELEAMGGSLKPTGLTMEVWTGSGALIGWYWPKDSTWGSFAATTLCLVESTGALNLKSERAAVDWILAQYFLRRSTT